MGVVVIVGTVASAATTLPVRGYQRVQRTMKCGLSSPTALSAERNYE